MPRFNLTTNEPDYSEMYSHRPTSTADVAREAGKGGGPRSSQGLTGDFDAGDDPLMDEIRKYEAEKNYKALFSANIAAYNRKIQAHKYLDDSLRSQGLGTQGYGTSAHVGVENGAAQLFQQNQQDYAEAERAADAEAQTRADARADKDEAALTERENQLVTFLQYSDGSDESIAKYMGNYGYTMKDGKWVDAQGNEASAYVLSAIQSVQETSEGTKSQYGEVSNPKVTSDADLFLSQYGFKTEDGNDYVHYSDFSSLRDATVNAVDDSQTKKLSDVVGNEISYLEKIIAGGTVQDGTLFKLQRGSGSREAYLVLAKKDANGNWQFYIVSKSDNEQEGGEVDRKYKQYNGPKEEIKGK